MSLPAWFRIIIALIVFCVFVVSTQTIQIFPGVLFSFGRGSVRDPASLPAGVASFTVKTSDAESLELWKLSPENPTGKAAIFFHGNGGSLEMFFPFQRWLADLGFTTYSYDYRGYGLSTGWPSEEGMKEDVRSVWRFLSETDQIESSNLTIVGFSVGTPLAAYLASEHEPKTLALLAPFPSVDAVVETHPVFRFLKRFLRWHLPAAEWIGKLKHSCFLVANGSRDAILSPGLAYEVFNAYQGSGRKELLGLSGPGHNDLLRKKDELSAALLRCH